MILAVHGDREGYLDALRLKIRDEGLVRNKAFYLAIGITLPWHEGESQTEEGEVLDAIMPPNFDFHA